MIGHRYSNGYDIIKKHGQWAIYKYWNSDHEMRIKSFKYLKDAVKWCLTN